MSGRKQITMKAKSPKRKAARPREKSSKPAGGRYILRLYITGQTPRSLQSVENLRALCDKYLLGQFDLEIIDIYQQPAMAKEGQIIAAPTLIKSMPLPLRRLVGDFSDCERVILGLDLTVEQD
jgi:circadian clock protein KaiB